MKPTRHPARLVLLVMAGLLAGAASAAAERLKPPLEAAIHLKVLGYDRALKRRAGSSVSIVVLYDSGSAASARAKDEIASAFRALAGRTKVQGLPVYVSALGYSKEQLAEAVASASAVYVAPGLEAHVAHIAAVSSTRDVPVLSGDRSLAVAGLTVAAYQKGRTASLTINLRAARSAGMDLDSRLFAIAEVLK